MKHFVKKYDILDAGILEDMITKFYSGKAVLHNIDKKNIKATITLLNQGSPFAEALLLKIDDEIAGYALLAFTYSNEAGGNVVWIEEIYIDEKFRGKQISKLLLKHILDEYKTAKRFRIDVVKDNSVSMNLFKSFDFEELDYMQYVKDKN